jgi:signal recognition particle subunit SRP19
MPTIVEEFDDDTDLPLPSQPLPHTGSRGPILEAISSDEDDLPTLGQPSLSSQSASATHPAWGADSSSNHNTVTDITPYKKYVFSLSSVHQTTAVFSHSVQMVLHLPDLH